MDKISYCKKCLLPSTKPNVKFNTEQICGACLYYEKKRDFYKYLKNDKQKIVLWLKKNNLDLLEKLNK